MKVTIVYYSYEGHVDYAAGLIKKAFEAAQWEADTKRVETVDSKQRNGLAKYIWGGSQVVMGKKPALKPLDFAPAQDELLIFGFPVWAGSVAPPLAAFIEDTQTAQTLRGKKAGIFCCSAGGKGKALEKCAGLLANAGCTVIGQTDFVNPTAEKEKAVNEKITQWVKELTEKLPNVR
jgi:flavodoxin